MESKIINGVVFTLNPNDHYGSDAKCAEACGLLLEWLVEAAEFGDDPEEGHEFLHEALAESYPYHMGWDDGGVEVVDGVFRYPGDPDILPCLSVVRGDEKVYIYPHAIVAVVVGDEVKWTRMD